MVLTSDQVAQFRQDGYVVVPGLLTKREAAAMAAEVKRLQEAGLIRNVRTEGDGATRSGTEANLQMIPLYPHSELFRALPFDDRVVQAVTALIGEPAIVHLDQLFLKPARHGTGTDWHQDNNYFQIPDPLAGTAMWLAAHDATVENGTLHVAPGSYREELAHERDPYSDHHVRCIVPEERAVPCEVEAGGAVFFCYGTAHSTRANRTDHDRAGVAYHFLNGRYADLVKSDWQRRWLTGPQASGGMEEYGTRVAGTFGAEVDRTLARAA